MRLANEYASVDIELDETGNGPRLRIEDRSTGVHVCLDPLKLQSLAWATHKDLTVLARPLFRERALERALRKDSGRVIEDASSLSWRAD